MNLEFIEIASSFVSLTPRNDGILAMTAIWWDPPVKLGDDKKLKSEDDIVGNFRILVIASEAKQSLGILDFCLGILNLFLEF